MRTLTAQHCAQHDCRRAHQQPRPRQQRKAGNEGDRDARDRRCITSPPKQWRVRPEEVDPVCRSATASPATTQTSQADEKKRLLWRTTSSSRSSLASASARLGWRHSAWTHYETARPGMFKLVPPPARHAALARDYATMASMFMGLPIEFDAMLQRLQTAEQQLNDGSLLRPT